jgi:hypothetical protein
MSLLAVLGLELGCASKSDGDDGTGNADATDTSTSGELPDMQPPAPFVCANPVEIMQAGTNVPSGFVQCDGGFVHRVEAVECVMPQAADEPGCADSLPERECSTAADCVMQPYGSCQYYSLENNSCGCKYGCASDVECGPGEACVCAGVFSSQTQCIPAECLTDAGCGDGLCGVSKWIDDCVEAHYSLACAGTFDECHSDADCGDGPCPSIGEEGPSYPYVCNSHAGEGFACEAPAWLCESGCGRPFVIENRARTATTSVRGDWCSRLRPAAVDGDTAVRLAAHWTEIARFEHASIASFARMCLQLMQLGAPPSLLLATRAALGDEIEHARLAFGLASAYAGRELGAGPIEVAGSLGGGGDLHAIVEGLVREACVEETLSAIEASEAASLAEDPGVAAILEQIASDELCHARLGWQTLRWILEAHPEIRDFALDRLATAVAHAREAALVAADADSTLHRHGVLDSALRRRVRLSALATVLEPCIRACEAIPRPRRSCARVRPSARVPRPLSW